MSFHLCMCATSLSQPSRWPQAGCWGEPYVAHRYSRILPISSDPADRQQRRALSLSSLYKLAVSPASYPVESRRSSNKLPETEQASVLASVVTSDVRRFQTSSGRPQPSIYVLAASHPRRNKFSASSRHRQNPLASTAPHETRSRPGHAPSRFTSGSPLSTATPTTTVTPAATATPPASSTKKPKSDSAIFALLSSPPQQRPQRQNKPVRFTGRLPLAAPAVAEAALVPPPRRDRDGAAVEAADQQPQQHVRSRFRFAAHSRFEESEEAKVTTP